MPGHDPPAKSSKRKKKDPHEPDLNSYEEEEGEDIPTSPNNNGKDPIVLSPSHPLRVTERGHVVQKAIGEPRSTPY